MSAIGTSPSVTDAHTAWLLKMHNRPIVQLDWHPGAAVPRVARWMFGDFAVEFCGIPRYAAPTDGLLGVYPAWLPKCWGDVGGLINSWRLSSVLYPVCCSVYTADPDKLEKGVTALMDYLSWGGHPAPLKRLNRALRGLPPVKRDGKTTPNPAWPR
jgi:hypothetical protein